MMRGFRDAFDEHEPPAMARPEASTRSESIQALCAALQTSQQVEGLFSPAEVRQIASGIRAGLGFPPELPHGEIR